MAYTQSPPLSTDEVIEFLNYVTVARVCSHNKDGSIHAVPVWFYYEGGKIVFGTPAESLKAKNIKRDKQVTLLIDHEGPPTRGVIIYGEAEISEENMDEIALKIFNRRMNSQRALDYREGLFKLAKWVAVHVTPKKMASFDYVKDTRYREATRFMSND
jgi:nitroimidazol reductase NimA-like FMN-containing flavoprotein (pyridoxamine 5'-phosphate oxidase superfamily)